ncbi:MAG: DUF333 domain-containing protein [Myxococcota bacterium]|jgi:hypothetical protein|nr:DUF333 domain-containing protein [Myxococcota bacterium]
MKRGALFLPTAMLALGMGCSGATSHKTGTDLASTGSDDASGPAIANPASTHCLKIGGRLEIHESPKGQSGVCVFSDGSRCEEWSLMRGQCQAGSCQARDGVCGPPTP